MDIANVLGLVIILGLFVAFLLLVWSVLIRRRTRGGSAQPASLKAVADAQLEQGERVAALVSEQIEEIVKRSLAGYEDLSDIQLDFGTAEDGSLEIWFDGTKYETADRIPDKRIREAISSAVRAFNR